MRWTDLCEYGRRFRFMNYERMHLESMIVVIASFGNSVDENNILYDNVT